MKRNSNRFSCRLQSTTFFGQCCNVSKECVQIGSETPNRLLSQQLGGKEGKRRNVTKITRPRKPQQL